MKKLLLLLLFAGLLNTGSVFGWGREGHETIAKIAERNLTKKAKKRIEKYLGGHSIVYFAKWMDEYRHTPEYKFTNYNRQNQMRRNSEPDATFRGLS